MNKLSVLAILLILITASFTVAEDEIDFSQLEENIDLVKSTYNENLDNIPGFVKTIIGNERINVNIQMNDGKQVILGAVTKNAALEELKVGQISDPTLNIYLTESAIQKIGESSNPVDTLEEAIKNDEITYKAVGIFKKMKFGVVSTAVKMGYWFRGVFGK